MDRGTLERARRPPGISSPVRWDDVRRPRTRPRSRWPRTAHRRGRWSRPGTRPKGAAGRSDLGGPAGRALLCSVVLRPALRPRATRARVARDRARRSRPGRGCRRPSRFGASGRTTCWWMGRRWVGSSRNPRSATDRGPSRRRRDRGEPRPAGRARRTPGRSATWIPIGSSSRTCRRSAGCSTDRCRGSSTAWRAVADTLGRQVEGTTVGGTMPSAASPPTSTWTAPSWSTPTPAESGSPSARWRTSPCLTAEAVDRLRPPNPVALRSRSCRSRPGCSWRERS